MNFSFDYYHNLEDTELYLCNPDGRELFPLVATDRVLRLRFNDLSELSFTYYSTTTSNDGTVIDLEAYDYIQTRRLIFASKIGWFIISQVNETDNGVVKYKAVECQSLQASFQDRGIYCEEKVYYLYNPSDPTDFGYDPSVEASVPSVVGQLYQQLGIQTDLEQGITDPATPYDEWTITYINSLLVGRARNFKESTSMGYDWMVHDVEEAFEVVILFDFFYKTIHIVLPEEITEKANVIYTFSNFMKDVEISEDASNIVTVMNCNGENCDITTVNPTGNNFICDFSYYMDDEGKWMSSALKEKISQWNAAVAAAKPTYESTVLQLRNAYDYLTSLQSTQQEISKIYTDLNAAVVRKSVAAVQESPTSLYGIVWAETVEVGGLSIDPTSRFVSSPLSLSTVITAYRDMPDFDPDRRIWLFSGVHYTGTVAQCYSYIDTDNHQYLYFMDSLDSTSYCKLEGGATINPTTYATEYVCKGFKRYIDLNIANVWMNRYDAKRQALEASIAVAENNVRSLQVALAIIAEPISILNYFADSPTLLKELLCYWVEGDYTNDNIAVLEDTTQAQALDLANELLDAGETELAKVCQPKLQFSLTSLDCTKSYEFRNQMNALELGKIITVEKEEGVWFYPALLEIEYNLDTTDSFSLTFANGLKLDDSTYTYGDLMSEASSTSRQVSANWQSMLQYSKDKPALSSLVQQPLSSTLHAAFLNMTNQEFTIDDTGILGKKFINSSRNSFYDEQMRITNNVILFTDDNWETVRTALGKIYYPDPDNPGVTLSRYGLIGETIIGSLVMGETLKIVNEDNSVTLDATGITIKNGSTPVFSASTDGSVTISGYDSPLGAVKDVQTIYYLSPYRTYPAAPSSGTWITNTNAGSSQWTKVVPNPISGYYYYTCTQTRSLGGSVTNTNVQRLEANNIVLNWCQANNTTQINGGRIYTGTVDAAALNAQSVISSFLTVEDSNQNVIFCADAYASDPFVTLANFTVEYGKIYSDLHSMLDSTDSGVYIGNDGISATYADSFGVGASMLLDVTTGEFSFMGTINALAGILQEGCQLGPSLFVGVSDTGESTGLTNNVDLIGVPADTLPTQDSETGFYLYVPVYNSYTSSISFKGFIDDDLSHTYRSQATYMNSTGLHTKVKKTGLSASEYRCEITYSSYSWAHVAFKIGSASIEDYSSSSGAGAKLMGTWYTASSVIVDSDARVKKDIEDMNAKYNDFFDNIRPRTYRYIDGTSGRKHTGFIAQEVASALSLADIPTRDFAGYTESQILNENNQYETQCGLRYEEFISLNTWQIQQLKKRVADLEREVNRLLNA